MKMIYLKHVVACNFKSSSSLTYGVYYDDVFQYNIQVNRTAKNTDYPIGHVALLTQMLYNYKSPDGFPISRENFINPDEAKEYFEKWIKAFSIQGYYSSPNWGRIPLTELANYCSIYTVYVEQDNSDINFE